MGKLRVLSAKVVCQILSEHGFTQVSCDRLNKKHKIQLKTMTQLLTEAIRIANTLSEEDQNADNNESALAQRTIAKNGLKPMFIKKVVVSESQNLLDKNFG